SREKRQRSANGKKKMRDGDYVCNAKLGQYRLFVSAPWFLPRCPVTRTVAAFIILFSSAASAPGLDPIPDKVVVLTFDDASKSHFTVARPILLKYKFGATFFITEGFDFPTNKKDYMTWAEIAQLHKDGFEIGNHTLGHVGVTEKALRDLP